MPSLAESIASHLPQLRRFARLLTGSQQAGDAAVSRLLQAIVADPAAYLLPDVTCDFSGVRLEQDGPDRVRVAGARGRPPPSRYKVTATAYDGYRTSAMAMLYGDDAVAKAQRVAQAMLTRVRGMLTRAGLEDFRQTRVEVLGSECAYGPHARVISGSHAKCACTTVSWRVKGPNTLPAISAVLVSITPKGVAAVGESV